MVTGPVFDLTLSEPCAFAKTMRPVSVFRDSCSQYRSRIDTLPEFDEIFDCKFNFNWHWRIKRKTQTHIGCLQMLYCELCRIALYVDIGLQTGRISWMTHINSHCQCFIKRVPCQSAHCLMRLWCSARGTWSHPPQFELLKAEHGVVWIIPSKNANHFAIEWQRFLRDHTRKLTIFLAGAYHQQAQHLKIIHTIRYD